MQANLSRDMITGVAFYYERIDRRYGISNRVFKAINAAAFRVVKHIYAVELGSLLLFNDHVRDQNVTLAVNEFIVRISMITVNNLMPHSLLASGNAPKL